MLQFHLIVATALWYNSLFPSVAYGSCETVKIDSLWNGWALFTCGKSYDCLSMKGMKIFHGKLFLAESLWILLIVFLKLGCPTAARLGPPVNRFPHLFFSRSCTRPSRERVRYLPGGEIHHSEVGVEGAVLLRLCGAGDEEKEPLRLASRLFDTPVLK